MFKTLLALFKRAEPELSQASRERVDAAARAIRAAALPAVSLVPGEATRSWVGQAPTRTPGFAWPRNDDGPLSFLAQIDLAEVRAAGGPDWLPDDGLLQVYLDVDADAYGTAPSERSLWSVIYLEAPVSDARAAFPQDLALKKRFPGYSVSFSAAPSLPPFDRWEMIGGPLDYRENQALDDALDRGPNRDPDHQIGGYPHPIQEDDMELHCELIDRGAQDAHNPSGDFDVVALKPVADERWRLLLQLDSDRRMKTSWWGGGCLYLFVPEEDARRADFSRVWLRTQFT